MTISPDEIIYWQWGVFKVNATLVFTWLVMAILVLGSRWITRHLRIGAERSRWQNGL